MEIYPPWTNSSHLKMDGWKMSFLLGRHIFRCYVSFREILNSREILFVSNKNPEDCSFHLPEDGLAFCWSSRNPSWAVKKKEKLTALDLKHHQFFPMFLSVFPVLFYVFGTSWRAPLLCPPSGWTLKKWIHLGFRRRTYENDSWMWGGGVVASTFSIPMKNKDNATLDGKNHRNEPSRSPIRRSIMPGFVIMTSASWRSRCWTVPI